jgi:hypothetical protein
VSKRRRPERRLVDEQLAEALIAQAQEQGVELLGEGGLLQQMTTRCWSGRLLRN